jgi:hypothetical protein
LKDTNLGKRVFLRCASPVRALPNIKHPLLLA